MNENTYYNIKISYLQNDYEYKKKFNLILLNFELGYENDSALIEINGNKYKNIALETDYSIGLARNIICNNASDVENIAIRLNCGKKIFIETNKKPYVISINKDNKNNDIIVTFEKEGNTYE